MNVCRSALLFLRVAAMAALTSLSTAAIAQQVVAVVGGTLVDGTGGPPLPNAAIIIRDGRFADVGPADGVEIPAGATVVRAEGKTVLPGLIEPHLHLGGPGGGSVDPREFTPTAAANNLKSYLKFGVTTIHDISANPVLHEQKAALANGQLVGPRLFGVRYGIVPPNAHPVPYVKALGIYDFLGPFYPEVQSVDEARHVIRRVAADNVDGVKIFHSRVEYAGESTYDVNNPKFSDDILRALVDEAHQSGLRVYVHMAYPSEAKEAVAAGADVLAHSISKTETGADAVFAMMAERGVYYLPTLSLFEYPYFPSVDPFYVDRLRGKVWDVILDSAMHPKSVIRRDMEQPGFVADTRRQLEVAKANLRRAAKAGVRIALGSDSGGAGGFHGATTIREMELMAEAGLSPTQVIVAATRTAAEAIGQGGSLGTVEPGKLGDLVLVDGEPLRDISDIRKLALVVKEGQVIDPTTLTFEEPPSR